MNKAITYSLISIGLFPLVPDRYKGVLLAVLSLLAFINLFVSKPKHLKYNVFFVNSSLYLLYLFSLLYTENISYAVKFLSETRLTAILLPFTFMLLSTQEDVFTEITKKRLIKVFTMSTFIFCLLYFLYLPFKPKEFNPAFEFPSVYFFRNGLQQLPYLSISPIYASIYVGISLIFITNRIIPAKPKLIDIVMFAVFIAWLLLLSSKMAILALIVVGFIALLSYFNPNLKQIILIGLSGLILLFGLSQISTLKKRTKEFFKKETYTEYTRHNSTSIRFTILRCGIKSFKENVFLGVGVGDIDEELMRCYDSISYDLVDNKYNTHNQYLSILLGTGIVGLLIFCLFLYYNFSIGINKSVDDNEYIYILLFYCINMLSENLLERQNGIILFYFFISYYSNKLLFNKTTQSQIN